MTAEPDIDIPEKRQKMEEDEDLKMKEQNQQMMVQFTSESGIS